MGVDTKTVCPFPYTAPPGKNATTVQDCTMTYGEALGPAQIVIQVLLLIAGVYGMTAFAWRIVKLDRFTRETKRIRVYEHPLFVHFVWCFLFSMFMTLGSIDLFGFWGYIPVEVYAVLDECTASAGISNGVMTVQSLHKVANGVHADRFKDRSRRLAFGTVCLVWINFVGFITVGIIEFKLYGLFEALKCFVGSFILMAFAILATIYAIAIRRVMRSTMGLTSNSSKTNDQIQQLRKKHIRFMIVVSLASLALLLNAVLAINNKDGLAWTIALADQPDAGQMADRSVYILNTLLCLYLFQVPGTDQTSSSPAPGHSPKSSKKHQISPGFSSDKLAATNPEQSDLFQGDSRNVAGNSLSSPETTG